MGIERMADAREELENLAAMLRRRIAEKAREHDALVEQLRLVEQKIARK
jgi:hypothetical protein